MGDSTYTYQFIKEKISDLELTPAQLALDPCTAGVVVTDVKTGEVRALVTYPSYDNNLMSGSVDAAYFSQLQDDMSRPLYNNATQAQKAPAPPLSPSRCSGPGRGRDRAPGHHRVYRYIRSDFQAYQVLDLARPS